MAGGTITRIALGGSYTDVEGDFNGFYERLDMTAGDTNAFKANVTNHGEPKDAPPAGKYFVKGLWTNHKDEPIKRAIYGQVLRFHIEMNKAFAREGDIVYFSLYDSDMRSFGNDVIKADDPIGLEHKDGSHRPYTYEKVNSEHKVIIEFSTTAGLEKWIQQLDEDRIFELYFRCSFVNRGVTEHVELPYNFNDYLQLGSIVIDRYKMPGLNADGTDIADDLTYGTGHPYKKPVYEAGLLAAYKKDYALSGFDINRHAGFANVYYEPETINLEAVVVTAPAPSPGSQEPIDIPSFQIQTDNTRVAPQQPTPEETEAVRQYLNSKNEKAKYSKEACYNTFYSPEFQIPWTEFKIKLPISTGLDTRIFDSFSDEWLFWDFKETAELYFARGELQDNLGRMIERFKQNQGGIYEDEILTRHIIDHAETAKYCQKVEDYIAEQLKNNFSKLEAVEDKEPYFLAGADFRNSKNMRKKNFSRPAYSYSNLIEGTRGLTIALNDIWATDVTLKEVRFKGGDDYTAKYEVTLWDHFGLDLPDMEKVFNIIPSAGEVFVCWFILQHLRGYKPFITKVTFLKEFSGNLQEGMAELEAQREEQRRMEAEELNKKIRQDILTGPKF